MSSTPAAPNPKPDGDGLLASLRGIGADTLRYLELKLRLASIEGGEAGRQYAQALAKSALGAIFIGAADLIACAALIPLLTDLIKPVWDAVRWEYLALLAGLAHALAGWLFLKSAKANTVQNVFPETIDQLKQDREWLDQTTENNR
ncbi:MAG: phage holin family protein [Verrucomicrobiales bacterium]|nr:phage holin family protein [Verrucomicrobiales bacterium]